MDQKLDQESRVWVEYHVSVIDFPGLNLGVVGTFSTPHYIL